MIAQLPLAFKLLDSATFASFFPGNNKQIISDLKKFLIPENSNEFLIYLWGKSKVGKTHLLQAACNYALEHKIQAIYLPLKHVINLQQSYDLFSGLENVQLLCLDDLHLIIKDQSLEEKLFYLFNNLRAKQHKLIVAADTLPMYLSLQLPDLKSRMSWGTTYAIVELTEAEKIAALTMRASQIGLELSYTVAKFLLNRVQRNTGELFSMLEILDHASLAAKRKLTIPFVKKTLCL